MRRGRRDRHALVVSIVMVGSVLGIGAWFGVDQATGSHASIARDDRYVVPDVSEVRHRKGYDLRPCPTTASAEGISLFTPQLLAGLAGAGEYKRTSMIDVGLLDLEDGKLWQNGAEYSPYLDSPSLPVSPGDHHLVLLLAERTYAGKSISDVAAAEVRLAPGTPVRWEARAELGGGTDAGTMGIGGLAALKRLAKARTAGESIAEVNDPRGTWMTPCTRFFRAGEPAPLINGVDIDLGGDGGWAGSVGYDTNGEAVDIVLPIGALPWSLLGLPGTPPPQAIADEPSSSSAARPAT